MKNAPRISTLAASTLILSLSTLSTLPGCIVASSKSHSISGAYVQPGSIMKVKLNKTTSTEVEEILGQPSNITTDDDGSETWTWNWTETKDDAGAVFLIFAGSNNKTITESAHIKFVDGVVVKKWRD